MVDKTTLNAVQINEPRAVDRLRKSNKLLGRRSLCTSAMSRASGTKASAATMPTSATRMGATPVQQRLPPLTTSQLPDESHADGSSSTSTSGMRAHVRAQDTPASSVRIGQTTDHVERWNEYETNHALARHKET